LGAALGEHRGSLRSDLRTGSSIVLDVRDPAHREIAFFGVTEAPTTSLFTRLAFPGWTLLDIGANAGYYSLLAHDLGGKSSCIHAFEPNPSLAAMFRESVRRSNADGEIVVNQVACGSGPGSAELQLSSDPSQYAFATLKPELAWFAHGAPVVVDVIDLDSYCETRGIKPDMVKLDVEGYEPEAIAGMSGLLTRHVPSWVVCEVVRAEARPKPEDVINAMAKFGYKAYGIADDGSLAETFVLGQTDNLCFVAPGRPT
jgi:FkbM family methyltransferase